MRCSNITNNVNVINNSELKLTAKGIDNNSKDNSVKSAEADYKTLVVKDSINSSEIQSKEKNTTKSSVGDFFKSASQSISLALSNVESFTKTAVSIGKVVKNTVSAVSKVVIDAANSISKTVMDVSKSITDKITKTSSQIASTVKQMTTTGSGLKEAAEQIKNSATAIVNTTVKTAVSVSADVKDIVAKSSLTVSGVKAAIADPATGVIKKGAETIGIIKNGVESVKDPASRIPNTISTGYKDIEKNYNDLVTNVKNSISEIKTIKDTIVSVSKDVVSTVKTVAKEVKDASISIGKTLKDSTQSIKNISNEGYKEVAELYKNYKNNTNKPVDDTKVVEGISPSLA